MFRIKTYGRLAAVVYLCIALGYTHVVPRQVLQPQMTTECQPIAFLEPANTTGLSGTSESSKADGAPSNGIQCFEPSEELRTTTVDGCRPVLNIMKTFPNYDRVQEFQEYKKPKHPCLPPWGLIKKDANCKIEIFAGHDESIVDKFSYKQIRSLATDIIEDCQPPRGAGMGGWSPIGREIGWMVRALGTEKGGGPHGGDDDKMVLLDSGGLVNWTMLPLKGGSLFDEGTDSVGGTS